MHDDITDVRGILVGAAQDLTGMTGCTVLIMPNCARAGVYVGGSAPSTRQMDSLNLLHIVDRIHGVCLCGGSAFGLDAGGGVLRRLAELEIGFNVAGRIVPIVPCAAIFDLGFGDGSITPDSLMGYKACEAAGTGPVAQGSVGAGAGATVGKLFGIDYAMKGGLGSSSVSCGSVTVGALVVVNAFGDVTDENGAILAGCRLPSNPSELADAAAKLKTGEAKSRSFPVENTTLAVIAANTFFDKLTATRIAAQANLALGQVIKPFHSQVDGDLTIALSLGEQTADPAQIALLAQEALKKAVVKAIKNADGMGLIPAYRDFHA
jgi:L-aminopeptidase/D-esterase-like protein